MDVLHIKYLFHLECRVSSYVCQFFSKTLSCTRFSYALKYRQCRERVCIMNYYFNEQ